MTGEGEPRRVLSESLWETWESGGGLIDRWCVRWSEAGSLGADVGHVRLMTWTGDDQPALPDGLGALSGVRRLELPAYLLKTVAPSDLPPSIEHLDLEGERSVTVARDLVLPTVRVLKTGAGPLRFSPSQFPALEDLTIRLDRKAKHGPDIVRGCTGLRSLGVTSPYDPAELPTFAAALPALETLGVAGGNVTDLSFVPAFAGLRELAIANLPKLTSIAPLTDAPSLSRVRLAYCQHIEDLSPLLSMPALRELEVLRCGDASSIRADLEARDLDRLTLI